jgi:hypothetical protein
MSHKGRIAMLAVASAVVMSIAAAPASAYSITENFKNWVVAGSLTPKKLNQQVTLPEGSAFTGSARIEWTDILFKDVKGTVTGTVSVPPFKTTINFLGVPTEVGVTFTQVGAPKGVITASTSCATRGACLTMTVPTDANLGIDAAGLLGVDVPTHCETSEPVKFALSDTLTLAELLVKGPRFSGTTTIPPMTCKGLLGLEGVVLGPLLSELMSGPENPYALSITP